MNEAVSSTSRVPVVYVPHGGGPWPFVDVGFGEPESYARLATYLRGLASVPKTPPRGLLVVSAHWEAAIPTVTTSSAPPLVFDYSGFPKAAYELTWPAPGSPVLAARVRELLSVRGISSADDARRGFDHGTFVPLKLTYPEPTVPTVQLSLLRGLDPAAHLALGAALQPLRDEGIFIVGSGMSYHNMRGFGRAGVASQAFDTWLQETVRSPKAERDARLVEWTKAPYARDVHPREEHLMPLMVVAGAAGDDAGVVPYADTLMSVRISSAHFG
jgi:aromatic ring-opening dioxygenase catalytic subunit (LigB family)